LRLLRRLPRYASQDEQIRQSQPQRDCLLYPPFPGSGNGATLPTFNAPHGPVPGSGYCEHYAYRQPLDGGVFYNHASLNGANSGLIELGLGIDNNQSLISLSALNGYTINDQTNNFLLSSTTVKVGQYFLQGLNLYRHLNNPLSTGNPPVTGDNPGRCSTSGAGGLATCTNITFAVPYNTPPVCTATNETINYPVQSVPSANGKSVTFKVPPETIACHCQGNPN
jgi:hypothetical protein